MSYTNAFIKVSPDTKRKESKIPPEKVKKTVARIHYELLSENPYAYTQDELYFKTHCIRNGLNGTNEEKEKLFSKPHACLRASALVKTYGFGCHYDDEGKIGIVPIESEAYEKLIKSDVKQLNGMKSKR